jgi:hypothetical protein
MSPPHKKLLELLEQRYGLRAEVAAPLLPVLDRCLERDSAAPQWDELLEGLAVACRAVAEPGREAADEVRVLVGDFLAELRKIDESLKVVSAFLARIRQHLQSPALLRTLH